MSEQHLTVDEVAALLRVSRWSIGRYIASGALRATKAAGRNGAVRIPVSALNAYIEAHTITEERSDDPRPPVARAHSAPAHAARRRSAAPANTAPAAR